MSLFVHPNVMPLIGVCFDEEKPLLIMPFMSKGNVLEYVKQNKADLHKDQEASEVEVLTLLVYVHNSKNKCSCQGEFRGFGRTPPQQEKARFYSRSS